MLKSFLLVSTALVLLVPGGMAQSLPSNVPKAGLELWFSAGHVEQTDGQITLIRDRGPKANNAIRNPDSTATASDPARATDTASGRPVLRFSGANVAFIFKRITSIRTAFWVVSKDPAAFGHKDERFVLGDTVSHDFHAGGRTDDTIFNTIYDNPKPSGHLSKYLHDGSVWLNGQPVDAAKTPFPRQLGVISIESTGPVEANQLARDRQFGSRSWQDDIAEILLYDVPLTDAQRKAVETYLLKKYRIKPASSTAASPTVPPENGAAQPR